MGVSNTRGTGLIIQLLILCGHPVQCAKVLPKSDPQSKSGFDMDPELGEVRDTPSYGHFVGKPWLTNYFWWFWHPLWMDGGTATIKILGFPLIVAWNFKFGFFRNIFMSLEIVAAWEERHLFDGWFLTSPKAPGILLPPLASTGGWRQSQTTALRFLILPW